MASLGSIPSEERSFGSLTLSSSIGHRKNSIPFKFLQGDTDASIFAPSELRLLKIRGDSMEPVLHPMAMRDHATLNIMDGIIAARDKWVFRHFCDLR